MNTRIMLAALAALALVACSDPESGPATPHGSVKTEPAADMLAPITDEALHEHVAVLASDEFEGRLPATPGGEKTVAYLVEQFRALGLEPGNAGSYTQDVPLVAIDSTPSTMTFATPGGEIALAPADDMVAWTRRVVDRVSVQGSELVFVGYGVVAPEYGWDDYRGLDVKGKTVVMLVNDPGFGSKDPELFTGEAMTYYGRWTYKFEEAARQGAEAAIVIHQTAPASYGWDVVRGSWTGEQFGLVAEDRNMSRATVESWITEDAARELFAASGQDFDALAAAAHERGFEAVPLDATMTVDIQNAVRESVSQNVVALLPGRGDLDEYVLYTAHWDHIGRDGDDIYNGAVDNASGTAGLLVLAEAFAALDEDARPNRSIVFVAVTAEEQGLLGSQHYAENPLFPLAQTVAVVNMDSLNYIGPTRDITVVGYGASDLDRYVDEVAADFGREVKGDPRPAAGIYYRSDHFNFAKQGVPALYPNMGRDLIDGGREEGMARAERHNATRYHSPADDYSPDMDLTGAAEDLKLFFEIGRRIAESDEWPNWAEGNEFRMKRDAQRQGAGG